MTAFDLGEAFGPFDVPIGRVWSCPSDSELTQFGFAGGLTLAIRRNGVAPRIRVAIDGKAAIWGQIDEGAMERADGVAFDHYAFLQFFATNWAALWLERPPPGFALNDLTHGVQRSSDIAPEEAELSVIDDWVAFQGRHCVSNLLVAPGDRDTQLDWWLVAVEDELHVAVPENGVRYTVSLGQGMSAIERCCDRIARWIFDEDSESGRVLVQQWADRRRSGRANNASLYMGVIDPKLVADAANDLDGDGISAVFQHNSPLLAVARMRPAYVSADDLSLLFAAIRRIDKRDTVDLDHLAEQARLEVCSRPWFDRLPSHQQGRRLALWLRGVLDIVDHAAFEPSNFLRAYGVHIDTVTLSGDAIDAIAFWGDRNGPGVILNTAGRHASSKHGVRATLAHEICHLLIDRGNQLPLVDVVGGLMSEVIEKRARACAAELLLPQDRAYEAYLHAGAEDCRPRELAVVISSLMDQYNVSQWIAGHQLSNAIKSSSAAPSQRLAPILTFLSTLTRQVDSRSLTGV